MTDAQKRHKLTHVDESEQELLMRMLPKSVRLFCIIQTAGGVKQSAYASGRGVDRSYAHHTIHEWSRRHGFILRRLHFTCVALTRRPHPNPSSPQPVSKTTAPPPTATDDDDDDNGNDKNDDDERTTTTTTTATTTMMTTMNDGDDVYERRRRRR